MRTREDFPVATRLMAPAHRPAVADFYRLARAADDAADAPGVAPETKRAALARHAAGLDGDGAGSPEGLALRARMEGLGLPASLRHARDLLAAFRRDADGADCADWDDLMGYCALSAAPVGRFLLDLHGERPAVRALSDPLCVALQVLNHIRDLAPDWRGLGRLYLPADWRRAAGADPATLLSGRLDPAWAAVVSRSLDGCDALLARSAGLAAAIDDRRLAAEAAATQAVALRIAARLRAGDPLARRIRPSALDAARAGLRGTATWLGRMGQGARPARPHP